MTTDCVLWNEFLENWESTSYYWDQCKQIANIIVNQGIGSKKKINEKIDQYVILLCKVNGYNETTQKQMKKDIKILINNIIKENIENKKVIIECQLI